MEAEKKGPYEVRRAANVCRQCGGVCRQCDGVTMPDKSGLWFCPECRLYQMGGVEPLDVGGDKKGGSR